MTGVHLSRAVYNFVRYLIKVAGDVDIRLRAHRWGFGVGVTGLGETGAVPCVLRHAGSFKVS